jgi:hypothetical protein
VNAAPEPLRIVTARDLQEFSMRHQVTTQVEFRPAYGLVGTRFLVTMTLPGMQPIALIGADLEETLSRLARMVVP